MQFVPYVKFTADADTQLLQIALVHPAPLKDKIEALLRLLPSSPDVPTKADPSQLRNQCDAIVQILEEHEDCEDYDTDSFHELAEFLEASDDTIEMVLRNEPKTIDELIICAAEGGLDDEWTQRHVADQSAEYLAGLKDRIEGSDRPANCFAVIRLLLMCFPRNEVAPTIEAFINRTEDEEFREQAAFLLAVFDA